MIFGEEADAIVVDTLLLSCRVLGRGVEHAMLARLGALALERSKARVDVPFIPTAKNQLALNFLISVGASYRHEIGGRAIYKFPADTAAGLTYTPGADAAAALELAKERPAVKGTPAPVACDRSATFMRIAMELRDATTVLSAVERPTAERPDLDTPYEGPRTALERDLAELWSRLLRVDRVGVFDDFTALGGTSLKAAHVFVEIDERFGRKLPMTTILDAPTVASLAPIVAGRAGAGPKESLRRLREGTPDGPALFLIHDGDGETFLYMNLARRLPPEVSVYGLEPRGLGRLGMIDTRIPDLAAHYLREIRRVQPEGPYQLGGMCAGGVIAYEMALQLEARGESVEFVALLDPAAPLARMRSGIESEQRRARLRRAIQAEPGNRSRLSRLGGRLAKLAKKAKGFAVYQESGCSECSTEIASVS